MKWTLLLLLFVLTRNSFAYSELSSFADLKIPNDQKKTWVIFDIDNTLIMPKGEIGSHQWADYMAQEYVKKGHSEVEGQVYQNQIFARGQRFVDPQIVDSSIFPLLKKLESIKYPYFALTARTAQILKETTIHQLKQTNLLSSLDRHHPIWDERIDLGAFTQQGVVFSNGLSKGEILKKLIEAAIEKPERIIFVDDRDYNVVSIEKAGVDLGLEVLGHRFSSADKVVNSFNKIKADKEWFAAKYLGAPTRSTALTHPIILGKALLQTEAEAEGVLETDSEECHFKGMTPLAQRVSCLGVITNRNGIKIGIEREYKIKINKESMFYASPSWNNTFFIKSDWDLF